MDVKLIDVEHPEKAVAILFDVEPDILLSEMRNVISNQVADIISSNDYRFQHHEVELSRSQESSVILRNIALPSNDKSFWMVHVSFCNPGTEYVNHRDRSKTDKTVPKSAASAETSLVSSLSTSETEVTSTSNVLQLRRLSDVELRNIKIYSNADIKKGKGSEKEYRRFWNEEVRKMAKDTSIGKKEMYKQVNERWKLKRCSLLEAETKNVQELEKSIAEKADDWQAPKTMKKATISKNIERVREATESTQSLRETVGSMSQTLKRNPDLVNRAEVERNVKRAKTSLISSMSELRKAQDTLRKNLGAKKSQLSEYLK